MMDQQTDLPLDAEDDLVLNTPSDLGNARRMVRRHGENIRYVHDWKAWIVWEDGHWRRDNDAAVMRMAKATVEKMFEEALQINDETAGGPAQARHQQSTRFTAGRHDQAG